MHDYGLSVLEQYGLTAETVIRGRGSLICVTDRGLKNIREYWGSPGKISMQREIQKQCREAGYDLVDLINVNQEGEIISKDADQIPYVVRDWFRGRECDTHSGEDINKSVCALADLHNAMRMERNEEDAEPDMLEECRKHNRELRKIRKYVQNKKRKNEFEERMAQSISRFLEKGEEAVEELEKSEFQQLWKQSAGCVCHGECNQHNILFTEKGIAFTGFEHWHYGVQIEDLAQFMRKILEKHRWNPDIGNRMLLSYRSHRELTDMEVRSLWLLLSYPWKYWKLANYYAGSNKILISGKNLEKLNQTIALWEPWQDFLRRW